MRKRDNSFIKNVDFTKLNELLREKGIAKAELSRRCGYNSSYVKDTVFREKKLNWTVANMLERVYGISLDEYCYEQTEKSTSNNDTTKTTDSNDDSYILTFSFNGEFLKKLALASINEHMSIEDFVFKCLVECIGDKILDDEKTEGKN